MQQYSSCYPLLEPDTLSYRKQICQIEAKIIGVTINHAVQTCLTNKDHVAIMSPDLLSLLLLLLLLL